MPNNSDIETLMDLNGMIIEQVGGYWVKFEVKRMPKSTEEMPHGIRYSLTLHDRHGSRVMGFDNAHAVKMRNNNQSIKAYDHRHRHSTDEGIKYEFVDAHQLLKDFWSEVDKILKALGLAEDNL